MTATDLDTPQNLLPWFVEKVATASADEIVEDVIVEPIKLRPNLPERRRTAWRWIILNLTAVLGIGIESIAIIIVLTALPFAGNTIALIALVVVANELRQRRTQQLTLSALDDLPRIALVTSTTTIAAVLLLHSSTTLVLAAVIAGSVFLAVLVGRMVAYFIARRLRRREAFQRRTVIVGSGLVASELVSSMQSYPEHGLQPRALLDDSPMPAVVASNIPIEPLTNQLRTYIAMNQIDTIVIAFSAMRESALLSILRECDRMDCEIFVVPRLFEFVSVSGEMDRLHAIPLVRIRRDVHRSVAWKVKRLGSKAAAAMAILALSPLLAALAFAVWMSDRTAPILFKQTRVTGDGREFMCLKFRSMKPESTHESDTTWNISQDDRIGPLGHMMRKSSLDELPQLWNILVGDMDLVGPRPERPHFVDQFKTEIPGYSARHRVPGGLTGWAAVHGLRGDTSLRDRAQYDNYYIENWSLWLDTKILLRTVLSVVRRTGG